jgi:hypothetical protein
MLNYKPCNKSPDDCIDIFRKHKCNDEVLSSFWLERDGTWTFDTCSITSAELREIADELDRMNKDKK